MSGFLGQNPQRSGSNSMFSRGDIRVSVRADVKEISDMFFTLQQNMKDKFLKYSLNQVGAKAKTAIIRTFAKELSMPPGVVRGIKARNRPMLTSKKSTDDNLSFEIGVNGLHLHISNYYFRPKEQKSGVSAAYYGRRHTFKGSFLGRGKQGETFGTGKMIAWKRTNQFKNVQVKLKDGKTATYRRARLHALFAFNPVTEFEKARFSDEIIRVYSEQIPILFHRKLDQFMSRPLRGRRVL